MMIFGFYYADTGIPPEIRKAPSRTMDRHRSPGATPRTPARPTCELAQYEDQINSRSVLVVQSYLNTKLRLGHLPTRAALFN